MEQPAHLQQGRLNMTFMDKAKDLASKVTDKANQVAGELADKAGPIAEKAKPLAEKAAPLAEKAGNLAAKGVSAAASSMDKATGGKYHDRIETVTDKLGEALNRDGRTGPTEEPNRP
ncbi:MAG TPA: antitoxin [Pseudonocardiaceae bacterium]